MLSYDLKLKKVSSFKISSIFFCSAFALITSAPVIADDTAITVTVDEVCNFQDSAGPAATYSFNSGSSVTDSSTSGNISSQNSGTFDDITFAVDCNNPGGFNVTVAGANATSYFLRSGGSLSNSGDRIAFTVDASNVTTVGGTSTPVTDSVATAGTGCATACDAEGVTTQSLLSITSSSAALVHYSALAERFFDYYTGLKIQLNGTVSALEGSYSNTLTFTVTPQ